MQHRNIMRIELSGDAMKKLSTLSDRNGMTQVAMMSRLVEWFASQDRAIQAATLMPPSKESDRKTARMIIERMAKGK